MVKQGIKSDPFYMNIIVRYIKIVNIEAVNFILLTYFLFYLTQYIITNAENIHGFRKRLLNSVHIIKSIKALVILYY